MTTNHQRYPNSLEGILNQAKKIPTEMQVQQAIEYIKSCNSIALVAPEQQLSVRLLFYDPFGTNITVENINLTQITIASETTLQELVTGVQERLDQSVAASAYAQLLASGQKLLVKGFHIQVSIVRDGLEDELPMLKAEVAEKVKGREVGYWLRWKVEGGEAVRYWEAYRTWLRIGGNLKPFIKVHTIRREDIDGDEIVGGGHLFDHGEQPMTQSDTSAVKIQKKLAIEPGDKFIDNVQATMKRTGVPFTAGDAEILFACNIALIVQNSISEDDCKDDRLDHIRIVEIYSTILNMGVRPMDALVYDHSNHAFIKQSCQINKVDWAFYQKKGGNPRMHRVFPLDRVSFEHLGPPIFVGPDHPDYLLFDPEAGLQDQLEQNSAELEMIETNGNCSKIRLVQEMPYVLGKVEEDVDSVIGPFLQSVEEPIIASNWKAAAAFDTDDDDKFFHRAVGCRKSRPVQQILTPSKNAPKPIKVFESVQRETKKQHFEMHENTKLTATFNNPYQIALDTNPRLSVPYKSATNATDDVISIRSYASSETPAAHFAIPVVSSAASMASPPATSCHIMTAMPSSFGSRTADPTVTSVPFNNYTLCPSEKIVTAASHPPISSADAAVTGVSYRHDPSIASTSSSAGFGTKAATKPKNPSNCSKPYQLRADSPVFKHSGLSTFCDSLSFQYTSVPSDSAYRLPSSAINDCQLLNFTAANVTAGSFTKFYPPTGNFDFNFTSQNLDNGVVDNNRRPMPVPPRINFGANFMQ